MAVFDAFDCESHLHADLELRVVSVALQGRQGALVARLVQEPGGAPADELARVLERPDHRPDGAAIREVGERVTSRASDGDRRVRERVAEWRQGRGIAGQA